MANARRDTVFFAGPEQTVSFSDFEQDLQEAALVRILHFSDFPKGAFEGGLIIADRETNNIPATSPQVADHPLCGCHGQDIRGRIRS
jgi:hypothetical protein